ncbi:MAG TPA: hypothetical protein VKD47_02420 [Miltoncostaeaceae bacterium]|nr:hypothetical protein [Miltoncostaeaceae bacterium]
MIDVRTRRLLPVLAAAVGAAGLLAASATAATQHQGSARIRALDGNTVRINRFFQDNLRFAPGTITVRSGSRLTFSYGSRQEDPHTITIVPAGRMPKTAGQVFNCRVCQQLATGHLKNPKAPPSDTNTIVHFVLNKGRPGLSTVGDSIAISPQGTHRTISIPVTAPAGTTLHFLCAVHPWMQGTIKVV